MEGEQIGSEDAYFAARPEMDISRSARIAFMAGFERAWKIQQRNIEKLKHDLRI